MSNDYSFVQIGIEGDHMTLQLHRDMQDMLGNTKDQKNRSTESDKLLTKVKNVKNKLKKAKEDITTR